MNTRFWILHTLLLNVIAVVLLAAGSAKAAADFTVATPGDVFNFNINGVASSPTITLVRGRLYQFFIGTSSFHPFQLLNAGVAMNTASGVTNNSISSGTIFFRVPTNAVNYSYRCGVHTGTATLMGTILTIPPPPIQIVGLISQPMSCCAPPGRTSSRSFPSTKRT